MNNTLNLSELTAQRIALQKQLEEAAKAYKAALLAEQTAPFKQEIIDSLEALGLTEIALNLSVQECSDGPHFFYNGELWSLEIFQVNQYFFVYFNFDDSESISANTFRFPTAFAQAWEDLCEKREQAEKDLKILTSVCSTIKASLRPV